MENPEQPAEQHDHHCWLSLNGVDWRIVGGKFPYLRGLSADGSLVVTINLSCVNFERYCEMAALWDRVMY